MASSNRVEYSHEIHTARFASAVTFQNFCKGVNNVKLKYGLSVVVPVLLNVAAQTWKPADYTFTSWLGGNIIIFNDARYVEESGTYATIFATGDFMTYDTNCTRYRIRILWGSADDFSKATYNWVKN